MKEKACPHIFISHATVSETYAREIFSGLEIAGFNCWFAQRDVRPGEHYASELSRALTTSAAILIVLDVNANNSKHVLREVTIATERGTPIFVIQIGNFILSEGLDYLLSGIQRIFTEKNDIVASTKTLIEQLSVSIPEARTQRESSIATTRAKIEVPLNEWDYAETVPIPKWLRRMFEDKS